MPKLLLMKGGKSIPIPSYSPVFGSKSDLVFYISKIGIFLSFTWEMLPNFEGQKRLKISWRASL